MLVLDTKEFIDMQLSIAEEGNEVSLQVEGSSMSPFLVNRRDYVFFTKLTDLPKRGDIALFRRTDGSYILHRVIRITDEGYYFLGDNQNACDIEGPVASEQIKAVIHRIRRHDVMMDETHFWWKFFKYIWIRIIPFRRFLKRKAGWFIHTSR